MQFTTIPQPYAPLGGALTYAIEADAPTDLTVRILDNTMTELYGAKRFARATNVEFDIAPYLRRALHFTPTVGRTGIYAGARRVLPVFVEVASSATQQVLTAPLRTFLPTTYEVPSPALLTSMPLARLIPEGACDELSLRTDGQQEITVGIGYGPQTMSQTHVIPSGGLHLFLLNTADFPLADTLTVDAGPCGKVVYTLMRPVQGAVRLAWRSRSGSIEHYSFPIEVTAEVEATKQHAYGPEGHTGRTTFEHHRKLRSALETRAVLEALSELLCTPEAWLVEGSDYTPIDIISDRATVHTHGSMNYLEIVFRPKTQPRKPWN